MSKTTFKGTGVAIVTPFRNDGSIDFKSFGRLIDHIIKNGVEYIVVLGTTGENVTLTKDEAEAVKNYAIEAVDKRVPVVIGIGGNNTEEVVHKIQSCDFEGIEAILSVAPYYNKPTQKGLYLHYKSIATTSPVPVIMYNIPGRTGINMSADTTLKLAKDCKSITGIKEASGDLCQMMKIIKNKPKDFHVISGDDAIALPLVALGGSGVISVIANAFPKEWSEMIRNALENNMEEARELHYKLFDLIGLLFAEGNPAGIKAALHKLGIIQNFLRLPLIPVSDSLYKNIGDQINRFAK